MAFAFHPVKQLADKAAEKGEPFLTIALFIGAAIIVLIAINGSPSLKAIALAYIMLP